MKFGCYEKRCKVQSCLQCCAGWEKASPWLKDKGMVIRIELRMLMVLKSKNAPLPQWIHVDWKLKVWRANSRPLLEVYCAIKIYVNPWLFAKFQLPFKNGILSIYCNYGLHCQYSHQKHFWGDVLGFWGFKALLVTGYFMLGTYGN